MAKGTGGKTRTRKQKAPAPPPETARDRQTVKTIGVAAFHELTRRVLSHKRVAGDHNSAIGGLISDAVENKNLHKKAYGWYRQLVSMDAGKRAEMLFHFDIYRERGDFDAQQDMLEDRGEDEPENDAEDARTEPAPGQTLADAMGQAIADDENRDLRPSHMRQPDAATPPAETDKPSTTH